MKTPFKIKSERLYSSSLKPKDVSILFAFYSNKEAMKFRGSKPMTDLSDAYKMIEDKFENRAGIYTNIDNELVGTFLIKQTEVGTVEIGFSFGKEHWGNGYAQEVLIESINELRKDSEIKKIQAWCIKENKASVHLFRKFGFEVKEQDKYPESYLFEKTINTKERLIILSDLWGKNKSDWIDLYTNQLKEKYEIQFYDSCELCEIDISDYTEESLHHQFVSGGIERGVENLIKLEKERVHVLAFSIGGTIAWKFGLKSNLIHTLTCVSSTRLRKETEKPSGIIRLFYGENDEYRPNADWEEKLNMSSTIIHNASHDLYIKEEAATDICKAIMDQYLFESERLGFRNWSQNDFEEFYQLNSDKDVMEHFPKALSKYDTRAFIERLQLHYKNNNHNYFAVELKETGEFIGFIGLAKQVYETEFTPAVDIGWRLKKSAWGKGYATEGAKRCLDVAFNELQLQKVVSTCTLQNTNSENVMRKIGMTRKGEFNHPNLKEYPKYEKCIWYEITNLDWNKSESNS